MGWHVCIEAARRFRERGSALELRDGDDARARELWVADAVAER